MVDVWLVSSLHLQPQCQPLSSTKYIFVTKEIKTEFVEYPIRLENLLDQQPFFDVNWAMFL